MSNVARRSAIALGLGMAGGRLHPALAQDSAGYPNRPGRLLVGWAPGSLDFAARAVAERLTYRFGESFVVENQPGATGNIAAAAVARALPARDGRLRLMSRVQNLAVNAALRRDLPVEPTRDLMPVAQAATMTFIVAVPADLPVRSMAELVALARAQPGQLNTGTPGVASLQHLSLELLKLRAGRLDIAHVPLRGGSEINRELLGGRVQVGIDTLVSLGPSIDGGWLHALATLHAERQPTHPTCPPSPRRRDSTGSKRPAGSALPDRRACRARRWRGLRRPPAGLWRDGPACTPERGGAGGVLRRYRGVRRSGRARPREVGARRAGGWDHAGLNGEPAALRAFLTGPRLRGTGWSGAVWSVTA